jgi:two-component system sensor histidine kinase RegB
MRGQARRDAGMQTGEIDCTDLGKLLAMSLEKPLLKRVRIENGAQGTWISCDAAALIGALRDLIKNACEASGDREVELTIRRFPAGVRFEIRDSGVGIPCDAMDRIGEPFYTTKAPGEGMGLGVFLVRSFAARMNGQLQYESEPGKGSLAILTLPTENGRAAAVV